MAQEGAAAAQAERREEETAAATVASLMRLGMLLLDSSASCFSFLLRSRFMFDWRMRKRRAADCCGVRLVCSGCQRDSSREIRLDVSAAAQQTLESHAALPKRVDV